MSSKIKSSALTTCGIADQGEVIQLSFLDESNAPLSLQLPCDQAEAIAMTLPRLLSEALKARTGDDAVRYVFALGDWRIEQLKGAEGLLLTLSTTDGFQVSFSLPLETGIGLGSGLTQEVHKKVLKGARGSSNLSAPQRPARLN